MITLTVTTLETLRQKTIGLIGAPQPKAVSFHTRWGIHTFGVRFPIDVLILDETGSIQALKRRLQSNRLWFWPPQFHHVIELPVGTIKQLELRQGQRIRLQYRQA